MKIAVLTPYWLDTVGGITTYVFNLTLELSKRHCADVSILTSGSGVGTISLPSSKLACLARIPLLLRKINPEIIHCHALEVMLVGAVLYIKVFSRSTSLIFTFHTQPSSKEAKERDKGVSHAVSRRWASAKARVFRWALRQCDMVTCVSRSLGEELLRTAGLPIENYVVTTPGVRKPNLSDEEVSAFRQDHGLSGSSPILCTVCVLTWENKVRGIEMLLRAFREILVRFPSAKLMIVGDGVHRRRLELLRNDLGLMERVVFLGNISDPFVPLWVSDVYCHISLQEGLPNSILEAMVCGKPIVAAKIGGIPEVIQSGVTGILVEPDVQSVIDGIKNVLDDPISSRRLATNASTVAIEEYSWDKIGAMVFDLYESLRHLKE